MTYETLTVDQLNRERGTVAHKPQSEAARVLNRAKRNSLQDAFLAAWKIVKPADWPDPVAEYRFHTTRKWRFDFAWPQVKVAVELHGGNFVSGGHNRGGQQAKDYAKANEAVRLGWRLLQFGTEQMHEPLEVAQYVVDVIVDLGAKGASE